MTRLALAALIGFLTGCGSARIPPPYTEQELEQECERHGGWWREGDLSRGFCEMPSMN